MGEMAMSRQTFTSNIPSPLYVCLELKAATRAVEQRHQLSKGDTHHRAHRIDIPIRSFHSGLTSIWRTSIILTIQCTKSHPENILLGYCATFARYCTRNVQVKNRVYNTIRCSCSYLQYPSSRTLRHRLATPYAFSRRRFIKASNRIKCRTRQTIRSAILNWCCLFSGSSISA